MMTWRFRVYALRALLTSLAPLIGAEVEIGKAVLPGWDANISDEKILEWTKTGMELEGEMQKEIMQTFRVEFLRIMRKVRRVYVLFTLLLSTRRFHPATGTEERGRLGPRHTDQPTARAHAATRTRLPLYVPQALLLQSLHGLLQLGNTRDVP